MTVLSLPRPTSAQAVAGHRICLRPPTRLLNPFKAPILLQCNLTEEDVLIDTGHFARNEIGPPSANFVPTVRAGHVGHSIESGDSLNLSNRLLTKVALAKVPQRVTPLAQGVPADKTIGSDNSWEAGEAAPDIGGRGK